MSQPQDGYHPPSIPSSGTYMQSRRQQSGQPPLITTLFNRSQATHPNTPLPGSAVSTPLSPMFSPVCASIPSVSSSMASGMYNPRQWSQSGHAESSRAASGASYRGSTRDNTGMEPSMPSPPPPYTPPTPASTLRPIRPATSNNDLYAASPLATSFSSAGRSSSRSSPQVQMAPHFPPPPSKDKSSARTDRDSSKPRFSLSAFTAIVKRPDLRESQSRPPSPVHAQADAPLRPPAGRRAISTGGISLPSTTANNGLAHSGQASRGPSPESSRWEPGMPLPPPPPGPPPPSTTARSHSLNRHGQQQSRDHTAMESGSHSRHTAYLRESHRKPLGAIPPTPAGWTDNDPIPGMQSAAPPMPRLRLDSDIVQTGSTSLTRRSATRDPSADSILERRSKSRAGASRDDPGLDERRRDVLHATSTSVATFPKPAKLVLSSTDPLLQRRMAERSERAEQSDSRPGSAIGSISQPSPETVRRQNAHRTASTLTPPYTPAAKLQSDKNKRITSESDSIPTRAASSDAFVQSSLERFHMFIQQEASSPSDQERLELFASFMVQESRIRRDLYSVAFNSMAGQIMELTRDMWRPAFSSGAIHEGLSAHEVASGHPARASASPTDSRQSGNVPGESSCSSATDVTPATDTESFCGELDTDDNKPPPLTPWGEKFQPSLSPIKSVPSMAVSTVPDEEDSRGRSASRWWEGSGEGSTGNGGRKLEMTKEESKYMSLHPKELIVAAQPSPSHSTPTPRTTETCFLYGADEYPLEKAGMHEGDLPIALNNSSQPVPSLSPRLDSRGKRPVQPPLDVSRLVTLPPPFPRHYPAVHNNHPSLHTIRVRHREIASTIGARQNAPQDDPSWQSSVYTSRLQTCEASITELVHRLNSSSDSDPSLTAQTEGDERPEILEELTLLKWIFEAREQLQKQDFDAQMQQVRTRSQAYTNHCQSISDFQRKGEEEGRLARHLLQSQLAFSEQATKRFSHLLEIVEHYVNRGVEVQLSAFWDIAPSLLELVQKVPARDAYSLSNLSVLVPSAEVADNPSYTRFPLQYLLATLNHAKKSAYQFVESQTNLLCLLHEVRTAAMSAEVRMVEVRRCAMGEDQEFVRHDMASLRREKEDEETVVLKERVGVLDGQWGLALGDEVERVIGAVEDFLRETGGWDEGMSV